MVKNLGIGAVCLAPLKCMKPSQVLETRVLNARAGERLTGLLAIRKEVERLNRKDQVCIVFRHPDYENQELHCHIRWARVETEGPEAQFFGEVPTVETVPEDEEEEEELPSIVENSESATRSEDIDLYRQHGYDVDDDNLPKFRKPEGHTVVICHAMLTFCGHIL